MRNRNEELNRVNNDLNNLFGSVQMAIVMVWRDLRIRRFTPLAEKIFRLIASDIGRPISDIKLKIEAADLPQILMEVIDSVTVRELEVQDSSGHWYQLRVCPYRIFENQIDGAIIILMDIDALKRTQEAIARQAQLLEHTSDAIFVHDADGVVQYWNRGAELLYGASRTEAVGNRVRQFMTVDPAQAAMAQDALARGESWQGELTVHKADGSTVIVSTNQVAFSEGSRRLTLETHHDVTQQKRLEEALERRLIDIAGTDKAG